MFAWGPTGAGQTPLAIIPMLSHPVGDLIGDFARQRLYAEDNRLEKVSGGIVFGYCVADGGWDGGMNVGVPAV